MAYLIPPLGIALTEPSRCIRHCRFALKGSCKFRSGFADCERAFSLKESRPYCDAFSIQLSTVNYPGLRVAKRRNLIAPKRNLIAPKLTTLARLKKILAKYPIFLVVVIGGIWWYFVKIFQPNCYQIPPNTTTCPCRIFFKKQFFGN